MVFSENERGGLKKKIKAWYINHEKKENACHLSGIFSHITTQGFPCSSQKYLSQSPRVMQDFHSFCGKEPGKSVLATQRCYNRRVTPAETQTHPGEHKEDGDILVRVWRESRDNSWPTVENCGYHEAHP